MEKVAIIILVIACCGMSFLLGLKIGGLEKIKSKEGIVPPKSKEWMLDDHDKKLSVIERILGIESSIDGTKPFSVPGSVHYMNNPYYKESTKLNKLFEVSDLEYIPASENFKEESFKKIKKGKPSKTKKR